jgi:hypothetical protein
MRPKYVYRAQTRQDGRPCKRKAPAAGATAPHAFTLHKLPVQCCLHKGSESGPRIQRAAFGVENAPTIIKILSTNDATKAL